MSNTNNRFLQSNLTSNDLATETTLKDIDQVLRDGTIDVSLTGNNDVVISDINFTTTQTNVLNTNLEEIDSIGISADIGISDLGTQRTVIASDQPNLNNYQNYYMRSGKNTGTPRTFRGGMDTLDSVDFRQISAGLDSDEFFTNPTGSDIDIQMSCSSATHITQTLTVDAWQKDGTIITSNLIALNGQSFVSISFASDQIFRIQEINVITNTMDAAGGVQTGFGDIVYISPQGQSLTNGVPDANIMGTMNLGLGLSNVGQLYIAPTQIFHTLIGNFSSNTDQDRCVKFAFQFKDATNSLWFTRYISGFQNSQNFVIPSSEPIIGGINGTDVRMVASLGDGQGTVNNVFVAVDGILE